MDFSFPKARLSQVAATATLLLACLACNSDDAPSSPATTGHYFNLADYFGEEAQRLQGVNPEVIKTVIKDGKAEEQHVHLSDWRDEFALFIDADINKPAWQHSYQVDSTDTSITYTRTDSTLRTESIAIKKTNAGKITHIHITNRVRNMLYQTEEQLDYYPDSLYRIVKQQHVRFLGENRYTVNGQWR